MLGCLHILCCDFLLTGEMMPTSCFLNYLSLLTVSLNSKSFEHSSDWRRAAHMMSLFPHLTVKITVKVSTVSLGDCPVFHYWYSYVLYHVMSTWVWTTNLSCFFFHDIVRWVVWIFVNDWKWHLQKWQTACNMWVNVLIGWLIASD